MADSFETLADQFAQEDQQSLKGQLRRSALISHNTKPDEYAKNRSKLKGRKINPDFADTAIIEPNITTMEGLADSFESLQGKAPKTAKRMANPDIAKIAHDDHENLSTLEKVFSPFIGAAARVAEGVNLSLAATGEAFGLQQPVYRSNVEYWKKRAEKYGMTGIASDIYKSIGEAPMGVAEFMAGVPYAGVKGTVQGYMKGGVEGALKTGITETVKRYGIGKVFKGIETSAISPTAKSATMAGTMGAQTLAEGGSVQDAITATVTGMALMPPGAKSSGEAVKSKLISKGVDFKIASEIGSNFDMEVSRANADRKKDVVDKSKNSKLKERDPDAFEDLAKELSEEELPLKTPVETIDDIAKSKGTQVEDVVDLADYYEAKFSGEQIELPFENLMVEADHIKSEHIDKMGQGDIPSVSEMGTKAEKAAKGTLKPAIKDAEGVKTGKEGEVHDDLAETPPPEESRGFQTPDGDFISREEASAWLKENRPDVFERLSETAKETLHSQDLWKAEGFTTEETKTSKLAKSLERTAIEARMVDAETGLGDLPTYKVRDTKAAAEVVQKVMETDIDQAWRIAEGKEDAPKGTFFSDFVRELTIKAKAEGDIDSIQRLVASDATQMAKTAGQIVQAFDTGVRGEGDLFGAIKEVKASREADAAKTGEAGKPKTKQQQKVETLEKEVEALKKKLASAEKKASVDNFTKLREEVAKGKKRKESKAKLDTEYKDLSERLNKLLNPNQLNIGVDPAVIPVIMDMAKNRIQRGIVSLDGVASSVYREVRKYAKGIKKSEIIEILSGRKFEKEPEKKPISFEAMVKRATESAEKTIKELERKIEEKDISKKPQAEKIETPELKKLREKIAGLRNQLAAMKEATKPIPTEEEIAAKKTASQQKAQKTRIENEIANLEKMLEIGDFAKKEKPKIPETPELKKLREELAVKRQAIKTIRESFGEVSREEIENLVNLSQVITEKKAEMEQGGDRLDYGAAVVSFENYVAKLKGADAPLAAIFKKQVKEISQLYKTNKAKAIYTAAIDTLKFVSDNSVAMVASFDNSFLGRQGLKTLMTHPSAWVPGAKESFKDFAKVLGGKHAKDAMLADIYSRENFVNGEYQKAKIISGAEEQFPTTIPSRLPAIGRVFEASEQAFSGSAMRMRADLYDLLSKKAKENGVDLSSKPEIESLGKLINSLTAKGKWGERGEPKVVKLVMWAPKMLKANIDVLTAHGAGMGLESKFARREAAINLLKIVSETALIMAIGKAFGAGVETDTRSADFGKLKFGDTRFDITGGAAGIVTLASRLLTGASKSTETGIVTEYGSGFNKRSRFDALISFLENKAAPPARVVIDWLKDKDFDGDKFSLKKEAFKSFTPISVQNMIKLGDDHSTDKVISALIDFIGINANSYDYDTQKKQDIINRLRNNKTLTPDQQKMVDDMPYDKLDYIYEEAEKTPLQAAFAKLSIEAMVYAYKNLPVEKQEEVKDIYDSRLSRYNAKDNAEPIPE